MNERKDAEFMRKIVLACLFLAFSYISTVGGRAFRHWPIPMESCTAWQKKVLGMMASFCLCRSRLPKGC